MTWPRGLRVDAADSPSGWWGEIFPVGSVYLTVSTQNPSVLFGFGTWTLIAPGTLLLGWDGVTTNLGQAGKSASGAPSLAIPSLVVAIWQRVA